MIKEKQGLKKQSRQQKLPEQAFRQKLQEYMKSMHNMERIDRPNSLLIQARMDAYLIETLEASEDNYGESFERLI